MGLTPWQEADWFAFHALEGVGGEAAEDARAMRLAVAGQCQDVEVIRSLFDRDPVAKPEDVAPPPLSEEERDTVRRFEESLRDRRARGEKV